MLLLLLLLLLLLATFIDGLHARRGKQCDGAPAVGGGRTTTAAARATAT